VKIRVLTEDISGIKQRLTDEASLAETPKGVLTNTAKKMKTNKRIIKIEYWLDGMTSSFQVTKKDYYNSYQNRTGFRLITFDNGTQITCV
jgi:hypothetical protein